MNLMAIDASTKATGVAIFKDNKLIHYECIYAINTNVLDRIEKITNKLSELATEYSIDTVALEDVLPEDVRKNKNVFTALIYLQAEIAMKFHLRNNLKINKLFVASEWRALVNIKTGRGVKRDTLKEASINYVKNNYQITVNDDVADAICIGLAYIAQNAVINWG